MTNRKKIEKYLESKDIEFIDIQYSQRKCWVLTNPNGNEKKNQPLGEYTVTGKVPIEYSFYVFPKYLQVYKSGKIEEQSI